MKYFIRFLVTVMSVCIVIPLTRAQQPVIAVEITQVGVFSDNGYAVIFVDVVNSGASYTSEPTISFSSPGAGGTLPEARAYISSTGTLAGIRVTRGGSGYSTPPTVTITGGGGVSATAVARLGDYFSPPNESFGPTGKTIGITAQATGTFLVSSFTYSFFVNGISIGTTPAPVPPTSPPPTVFWTPPQPGSYFITVSATDGVSRSTSLGVRYFAEGTVVNSPLTNTLVPQGSSVVIKADATVAQGFIREIQFYDNDQPIGPPDKTIPYSYVYSVPGEIDSVHNITARATDNTTRLLDMSEPIILKVVTPITPLPISSISTPADNAIIPIPLGTSATPIAIVVDATSRSGRISKVETYIDGELFGTKTTFPYTFSWTPTVVGPYRIVALTYDDKNNVIASSVAKISIAAPPSVSITSPSNNATVNGGVPVRLSAAASDSNVDASGNPLTIASVQFFVDGAFVSSVTTPDSNNIYSTTATLTQKTDGDGNVLPSVITALATDSGGITGLSSGVTVTVTKGGGGSTTIGDPPTVEVNWPAIGTQFPVNKPVLITAKAADTDGNIVSVQFSANTTNLGSTTAYPYKATWTPTSLGPYKLSASATDSDGNVVTSELVNISVFDPAPNPPIVKVSGPANGSTVGVGSTQTLRATATDAVSVASVEFFVNGVSQGAGDTTWPFEGAWSPATPGVYTISARALNASGNQATSPAVMVVVSENAGDAVFTGTYGVAETGNFAVIAGAEKAAFIGYSTTPGVTKTYRYLEIPVDVSGGYSLVNPEGGTMISGLTGGSGTSGTFDPRRLTFIGMDTRYFPASQPVANGYYTGGLTGRAASSLTAFVGVDGSIMLHVADGSFDDAGSGKVDATGAFNVGTVRGNRFTGKADPATRLLTGSLTGSNGGAFSAGRGMLGVSSSDKVTGFAAEVGSDIPANGKTYDQVLLQGVTASVTADAGQITRISYVDLSNDIVQVEFSGAGRLFLTLDNASGPAPAVAYNQPDVSYMKGHAQLMITGADETTNVSVFSVGRATATNQALFKSTVTYDGVADIGYIAILSSSGKFGGVRTANASYVAAEGVTGVCAPGVQMVGPVYIGDINASDRANAMILLGSASAVQINGGDLWQPNGRAVQVSGMSQVRFVDGTTSHGTLLPAQTDKSRLEQEGVDVTVQLVANPQP